MLKKLIVLGTGGTIAGTATDSDDNVGYIAAQVDVGQLVLDGLGSDAARRDHIVVSEQVLQVDSKDMGWGYWRMLAQRVQFHLTQADVSGLVITHGTDTLEETAFFLTHVLSPALLAIKPVVLTCAMRPATSLAPDGPQNLRDAAVVCLAPSACGVLVVCAGVVHAARYVQKVHPYRLNAFDSGDAGPLGYVEEGRVRWVHPPVHDAASGASFDAHTLPQKCPRVEVVTSHAGAAGAIVRALCAAPAAGDDAVRGIVVAATGNGTVHADLEAALLQAQQMGVRVVRATRCLQGPMVPRDDGDIGRLPSSQGLSPVKARIALALDLMANG